MAAISHTIGKSRGHWPRRVLSVGSARRAVATSGYAERQRPLEKGEWSLNIWGRNLTDELTVTRGFGTFGNDPRKEYALEPYYQFGEPRTVGATISYRFGE